MPLRRFGVLRDLPLLLLKCPKLACLDDRDADTLELSGKVRSLPSFQKMRSDGFFAFTSGE